MKNSIALLLLAFLVLGPLQVAAEDQTYQGSQVAYNQFRFAYTVLQRAQHSRDTRDLKVAAAAFDDFLDRFPDEPLISDALYYRALVATLQGDPRNAQWHISRAGQTVMVRNHAVDLLRGQLESSMGNHEASLGHLDKIDARKLDEEVEATVWLVRANSQQKLEKLHAAVVSLGQAAAIKSSLQPRALLELGQVREQLGRHDKALEALNQCVALEDKYASPEAAWLAGDLNFRLERHGQAIQAFLVVPERYPDSPRFAVATIDLMWTQLKTRRHDALLTTFRKYVDALRDADRLEALNLAATAYQRKGDYEMAVTQLQAVLNVKGSAIEDEALYKLALSRYELRQFKDMEMSISRLRASHPQSTYMPDAEFLLAKAYADQGKAEDAAARFTAIIEAGTSHRYYGQAIHQRAWLYESQTDARAAIGDYRRLIAEDLAVDDAQTHEVALRLINLYLQTHQFEQAMQHAERLVTSEADLDPDVEQEVLYRWGWAAVRLEKFEQAHRALAALIEKHPLTRYRAPAHYLNGLVLNTLSRHEQAARSLEEALSSDALKLQQRVNALRITVLHYRRHGRDEKAANGLLALDRHSQGQGLLRDERLWLGRYLQQHGRYELAVRFVEPLLGRDPNIATLMRNEAILLTARSLRALGQHAAATKRYRQVIATSPRTRQQASLELADMLHEGRHYELAIKEYAGLTNVKTPTIAASAMLHTARTYRELARRETLAGDTQAAEEASENARRVLLKLTILHSDAKLSPLPELARLELAEVENTVSRPDAANRVYQELVDQYGQTAYGLYAQTMLYLSERRSGAARNILHRLNSQPLEASLAKRVEARLSDLEAIP